MRSASSVLRWSVATVLLGLSVGAFATVATPDISGTWGRNSDPKAGAAAPDSPPPLKAAYASAYKAPHPHPKGANAGGPSHAIASEKCKVEGMPTIMVAREPLEILQTPGQVTVLAEYMTQTRRIYLDGSLPAADDVNPGYMGYSVAKWHGNTLEVQTIGIREDVRYRDIPHSAKMKIFEKIQLTAPDLLQDEITIVDPDTLTRPYRLIFSYKKDPGHRVMEYPSVLPRRKGPPYRPGGDRTQQPSAASALDKVIFYKLAWDAVGSEFASRHQHYEMFFTGASFVTRGRSFRYYDWDAAGTLVNRILNGYDLADELVIATPTGRSPA